MENQRAVAVLFIIGGVLAGVFSRSLAIAVMAYAALEDVLVVGVAMSTLIGLVVGAVTIGVLLRHAVATAFTDSVLEELKLVTWPSREETFSNTGIVVGATLFFAALLSTYDFMWAKLTGLFLYTTG